MIELSAQDKMIMETARMGRRMGFGKKAALVIIDAQVYMLGDEREPIEESIKKYPSSTGEIGWAAADHIRLLIDKCHEIGAPVVYTYMSLRADGTDAGPFSMKRDLLVGDNWMIEGTHGAEIHPYLKPAPHDYVYAKKRPSAFFGTPLEIYLRGQGVDTVIVTGGSTSNCVRATVFDSASYGYHTIVASDGCMDRMQTSHEVNLRDMDRQFADVMTTDEILKELEKLA